MQACTSNIIVAIDGLHLYCHTFSCLEYLIFLFEVMVLLTYGSHQIKEQVLGTFPEAHLVGELGAEEWDIGDRAGHGEDHGPVQTPCREGHVTKP